jgi:ABC-type Fe3+/spermidine/putrescine transport system ATPase subunit
LKQILSAVGSTTIVVTHDQDEAMSLADRIIVMNKGRIEQQGVPDEIYSRPASPFVATFIGRTNWFHGTISLTKPDSYARVVTAEGTVLTVSDPGIADDTEVSICVRPERMTVAKAEARKSGSDANQLPGKVADMINMGAELHYSVDCAQGLLMVVEPNRGGKRFGKGDKVSVGFRAEDCVVLPGHAA